MTIEKANWVPGLDLVRFCAAFMVAWYHLVFLPNQLDVPSEIVDIIGPGRGVPFLAGSAWFGWIGVEIFFVMSGFVIALTSQSQTPPSFLKSRFLRLYPAVWICATCTLLVSLTIRPLADLVRPYLHSIILYPNFPYIDVVYWTLGVEMSFYALVFALLVTGARRWISKSFFILGLVSTIFWVLWYFEEWAGRGILHSIPQRLLQLSLLQHGCFFAIGGILWIIKQRRTTIGESALLALFMVTAAAEITFHAQTARTGGAVVPALVWLGFLLLMAWTVTHTMRVRDPRLAYAIRLAGLTTYPLYLLHQACGAAFLHWLDEAGLGPLPSLVIAFSAILAMATIVAGLIEPVVRRYTDRLIVMIGGVAQRRFARAD